MRLFPVYLLATLALPILSSGKEIDFNRDIRPLLSQKCFACHGPDVHDSKGDLQLHSAETAKEALESGEFLYRITTDDSDDLMPPPKSEKTLKSSEIDLLKRWAEAGGKYDEPWAYVPPKKHPVPETNSENWTPGNWIDQFLMNRWSEEGVQPSTDSDAVTLVRRLHFDLTGLPPAPEVVEQFLAAENKGQAYQALIDQLLASPHFGERLAIYWLDLVRFADTVGYHGDQDHNITPYRDYVIDSFNQNLPFDQFTREQLAGDLLENPTVDQRVATGYNRLLQTSHEGGVQPKEYLAIYGADRIRNLSSVWMGGTLGCAQCHDHKYDPYTARDFYTMSAFFADVDEAQHFKVGSNSLPTKRPPEIKVLSRLEREKLAALEATEPKTPEVEKQIAALRKQERLTMVTVSIAPRETRILPRGNWLDDSGEIVEPAVPAFLGALDTGDRRANRLDLSNWLVDVESGVGGLTARVFVNRLWYLFFGEGISSSLGDFGGQGVPPVHPELLDNLSVEFYENGWDIKKLIKLLVSSRAYRQSSVASGTLLEKDPLNQLFARQSRYRLPAEFMRDNALSVSGLLNAKIGGPSAKPYQPEGYYRHLNFPVRKYKQHADGQQHRRGVYVHWQRQFLHPMMKAMDAPSREECTSKRPRSNTPTAAMVLLNDPNFVNAARNFAKRISAGDGDFEAKLDYGFRLGVSRKPDAIEKGILKDLFDAAPDENEGWFAVARAIMNTSEFNTRN